MDQLAHIHPQFYRIADLKIKLGVSSSSIWGWVKKGTFPAPIKLSANVTVWEASAIEAWAKTRIEASHR